MHFLVMILKQFAFSGAVWLALASACFAQESTVIGQIGDRELVEGTTFRLDLESGVDAAQSVTFQASELPSEAHLDPETGLFLWTPDYDQVGSHSLTFRAVVQKAPADSVAAPPVEKVSTETVLLTVKARSYAPELWLATTDTTIREGERLYLLLRASDKNPQETLTFGGRHLPEGVALDSTTGVLSWVPEQEHVGLNLMDLTVHDPTGRQDQKRLVVRVQDVEHPPTIDAGLALRYAVLGKPLTFLVQAADADLEQPKLSLTSYPEGAVLREVEGEREGRVTREFFWVPAEGQLGPEKEQTLTFAAEDAARNVVTSTVTIRMSGEPLPPRLRILSASPPLSSIDGTPTLTLAENKQLTVELGASDPNGGELVYRQVGCPCDESVSLDPKTGVFTWIPGYDFVDSGAEKRSVRVQLFVEDDAGLRDEVAFVVDVTDQVDTESRQAEYRGVLEQLEASLQDFQQRLQEAEADYKRERSIRRKASLAKLVLGLWTTGSAGYSVKTGNKPSTFLALTTVVSGLGVTAIEGLEGLQVFGSPNERSSEITVLADQIWKLQVERQRLMDRYTRSPTASHFLHSEFTEDMQEAKKLMQHTRSRIRNVELKRLGVTGG